MFLRLLLLLTVITVLSACMKDTNNHLNNIDRNMDTLTKRTQAIERIADSLASFEGLAAQVMSMMVSSFSTPNEPGETPDIDDVLGGRTDPAPAPSPTSLKPNKPTVAPAAPMEGVTVTLTNESCVSFPAENVHRSITDYNSYKDLDDGEGFEYPIQIGKFPIKKVRGVNMIKSQSRFVGNTGRDTDAKVYVVMQPLNLTNTEVYPTLLLRCISSWSAPGSFDHQCQLLKDFRHFGLNGFSSILEVREKTPDCPNGSKLKYKLELASSSDDVEAIKVAAAKQIKQSYPVPLGLIKGAMDSLFDEKTFFKSYYSDFYERWLGSIK